jgi:FixJ family two-component response regulator
MRVKKEDLGAFLPILETVIEDKGAASGCCFLMDIDMPEVNGVEV